ncbi:hypothetical protein NMG60_11012291 [Bertholletia excelsa]
MSKIQNTFSQVEKTCGYLLHELQIIWDDIGESEAERDKLLHELEQECLDVYRRKVDQADNYRAQLRQEIANFESELAAICSVMRERPVTSRQTDENSKSLKAELRVVLPQLEEMQRRKSERRNQFVEVIEKIENISRDLSLEHTPSVKAVDETDLSLEKLEELQIELEMLEKEKSDRLKHVLELMNDLNLLCSVLGVDFKETVNEVHPSLGEGSERSKNLSHDIIEKLGNAIQRLREVKIQRMQRLQDLATSLLEHWNLMDTPIEEQQMFQNVTCNIAASEDEITKPNMLSLDLINQRKFIMQVSAEVSRLEELKASKMKELVLKKRSELEEICRKTHLIPESGNAMDIVIEAIAQVLKFLDIGDVDPACVLGGLELEIARVKEEAFSRKEILEKIEKWLAACEEECWLEEYNMDENRYNAGRGTHLNLRRAERARALVSKIPAMVEALVSKTTAWENERGIEFTYDDDRLLSMLDEYTNLRQEKEQERKRQRDQKKLHGQLAEQEATFVSRPSAVKLQNGKRGLKLSSTSGKRVSTPKSSSNTPKRSEHMNPNDPRSEAALPLAVPNKKQNDDAADEENMGVKATPCSDEEVTEQAEYSFEERRAGFVLPNRSST